MELHQEEGIQGSLRRHQVQVQVLVLSSLHHRVNRRGFSRRMTPVPGRSSYVAGSKVADEERKRNATALHRFRQRRNEKEREHSYYAS